MNRRQLLSLAPLILVPEPRRAYSFLGGWAERTNASRLVEVHAEFKARGLDGITRMLTAPCLAPVGTRVGQWIVPMDFSTGGFVRHVNA